MSMGLSFIDFSGEYGMRHFFRSLSDADFAALNLFHIRIAVIHLFSAMRIIQEHRLHGYYQVQFQVLFQDQ